MGERLYVGVAVVDYNGDILGDAVLVGDGVIIGVGPADRFKGRLHTPRVH